MLKDILVHLDGTAHDDTRLSMAHLLARRFEAHLTGLFTNTLPTMVMVTELSGGAAAAIDEMMQRAEEAGNRVEARLKEKFAALDVPCELRRLDGEVDGLAAMAVREARWRDLFVALRPLGIGRKPIWEGLVEDVLLEGGRAVLLVPEGYKSTTPCERPFLCWDDSRAAARAMSEGIPFMRAAKLTTVGIVDADTGFDEEWRMPEADAARHLAREGVRPEFVPLARGDHSVGETLLRASADRGADLVILGGYNHARTLEWAFGGVTRTMLSRAEVPLLLAH